MAAAALAFVVQGCALAASAAGQRVRFAEGSSAWAVATDGAEVRVLGVPRLDLQWSRRYPVEASRPFGAELSRQGRYVLARSDERLWVTDRSTGSDALVLQQSLEISSVAAGARGARSVAALSPDERWFARVHERALQLFTLPDGAPVPPPAQLARYPRCAEEGDTTCGVVEVTFSSEGEWLFVLHRPALETVAGLLVHLRAPFEVREVPMAAEGESRVAFLGGSGELLFVRWGVFRLFGEAGERGLPDELQAEACPSPPSLFSRLFPTALCGSPAPGSARATIDLRELAAGRVLASATLHELGGLLRGAVVASAAGRDQGALLSSAGDVVLLAGPAARRVAAIGRRAPDPREAPSAPVLPAVFSDDGRALLYFTAARRFSVLLLE